MNKHLKNILLSTAIGLAIFMFFLVLNLLNGENIDAQWISYGLLITASYTYPLYYISSYAFAYAEKIGKNYNLTKWQSALAGFPFVIILNVVAIVIIQYFLSTYLFRDTSISFGNTFWGRIKFPLWISMTVGATFYIYHFIRGYQRSKFNQQEEKVMRVTQTHEALKSQIGPHFLFNSLNVLSGLVDENPDKAQDFIADLAQVYRYVLDQNDKDWVKLSDEIIFAENYLELVKTRFEDGLEVEIQKDLYQSDNLIAPLTLQLLLENCIKHNAVGSTHPLQIKIQKVNNTLWIENNLNPKKTLSTRKGTGLANIQSRYDAANREVVVSKTEEKFVVEIPLLTQNLIKMNAQQQFTEEEMRLAREEVRDRMGFYGNLTAYIVVCGIFVIVNLVQGGYFWAIWPMIGWGTGVIFHGLGVFVFGKQSVDGNSWENRQARKLLEKRKNNNL